MLIDGRENTMRKLWYCLEITIRWLNKGVSHCISQIHNCRSPPPPSTYAPSSSRLAQAHSESVSQYQYKGRGYWWMRRRCEIEIGYAISSSRALSPPSSMKEETITRILYSEGRWTPEKQRHRNCPWPRFLSPCDTAPANTFIIEIGPIIVSVKYWSRIELINYMNCLMPHPILNFSHQWTLNFFQLFFSDSHFVGTFDVAPVRWGPWGKIPEDFQKLFEKISRLVWNRHKPDTPEILSSLLSINSRACAGTVDTAQWRTLFASLLISVLSSRTDAWQGLHSLFNNFCSEFIKCSAQVFLKKM